MEETSKQNLEKERLTTNKDQEQRVLNAHQEDIKKIKEDYNRNKDKTVNYLVDELLNVDLTVPDVVIGKFAAKVLGSAN